MAALRVSFAGAASPMAGSAASKASAKARRFGVMVMALSFEC